MLNLSLYDENKKAIASADAIKPLDRALSTRTTTTKENATCTLLRLSQVKEHKAVIRLSGMILPSMSLLESGGFRAKKENKMRAVKVGIIKVSMELT